LNDSALCPRCGCDLELASRAESQAQNQVRRAIRCLAAGNPILAASYLESSLTLRRGPLAAALTAMLAARQAGTEARRCGEITDQPHGQP
jgi:hypothetical protein